MASNENRKVILSGTEYGTHLERKADAALTPGHLLTINSDDEVLKHNVSSGRWNGMIACEDSLQGKTIDDAYATGEIVRVWVCPRGTRINTLVAASAAAIVIGDWVESAGDGTVKKWVGLTDSSGGTANTTVQAIGGTYSQTEVANNFADVVAILNKLKYNAIGTALEAVDNSGGGSAVRLAVLVA